MQMSTQVRFSQPTIPVGKVEEDPRGISQINRFRGGGVSALPPIQPTESTTPTALRGSPRFRGGGPTPTPTGNRARSKKPTPPDSFHSDPYQTDFEKDPSEIQVGLRVLQDRHSLTNIGSTYMHRDRKDTRQSCELN